MEFYILNYSNQNQTHDWFDCCNWRLIRHQLRILLPIYSFRVCDDVPSSTDVAINGDGDANSNRVDVDGRLKRPKRPLKPLQPLDELLDDKDRVMDVHGVEKDPISKN